MSEVVRRWLIGRSYSYSRDVNIKVSPLILYQRKISLDNIVILK